MEVEPLIKGLYLFQCSPVMYATEVQKWKN